MPEKSQENITTEALETQEQRNAALRSAFIKIGTKIQNIENGLRNFASSDQKVKKHELMDRDTDKDSLTYDQKQIYGIDANLRSYSISQDNIIAEQSSPIVNSKTLTLTSDMMGSGGPGLEFYNPASGLKINVWVDPKTEQVHAFLESQGEHFSLNQHDPASVNIFVGEMGKLTDVLDSVYINSVEKPLIKKTEKIRASQAGIDQNNAQQDLSELV